MLSTIVIMPPAPDAAAGASILVRTLAALVPAAVDGVVRDVTLLQVGDPAPPLADIADEAGCEVVRARDFSTALALGVAGARSPWIFVVKAGTVPSRTFGEEAARAVEDRQGAGRAALLRERPTGLLARWFPALAPVAGVILARDRLVGVPCSSFAAVLRRARSARALPTVASAAP